MVIQIVVFLLSWLPIYLIKSTKPNGINKLEPSTIRPIIGIIITTGLALFFSLILQLTRFWDVPSESNYSQTVVHRFSQFLISNNRWIFIFIHLAFILCYWKLSKYLQLPGIIKRMWQFSYWVFFAFILLHFLSLPAQKIMLTITGISLIISLFLTIEKLKREQIWAISLSHFPFIMIVYFYLSILIN